MPVQIRYARAAPRRKIAELYEKLDQLREMDEIQLAKLIRHGIQHICFVFKLLTQVDDRNETHNWKEQPPVLFYTLPQSKLKEHPIDFENVPGGDVKLRDLQLTFRITTPLPTLRCALWTFGNQITVR